MRHRLLFHPDYRAANPYQRLLYDALDPDFQADAGDAAAALQGLNDAPWGSRVVLHLHWEDAIYRMAPDEASARAQATSFLANVQAFRDRGGIIVWTVHNARPHDDRYLDVHAMVARGLADAADLVLVHGAYAASFVIREHGIAAARVAVVPHGTYRTLHRPPQGGRAAARATLELPGDATVFLLFGRLGAYKGGAELLGAFARMADATARLVIAGKQIEPLAPILADLGEPVRARITVVDKFVPAGDVAVLLAAADAVVLPYRRILCSGAVLLAMGADRPVIVPDLPPLLETVHDGHNGLVHDAQAGTEGLARALDRFTALSPQQRAALEAQAGRTADGHRWASAGLVLSGLLRQAVARARPVRRLL